MITIFNRKEVYSTYSIESQARARAALEHHGILGGLPVEGGILWCATEKVSRAVLDETAAVVKEVLSK